MVPGLDPGSASGKQGPILGETKHANLAGKITFRVSKSVDSLIEAESRQIKQFKQRKSMA